MKGLAFLILNFHIYWQKNPYYLFTWHSKHEIKSNLHTQTHDVYTNMKMVDKSGKT